MVWLMVALGGAVGSVLRYGVGRLAATYLGSPTLLDTFFVNVSGSFALGVFLTIALERAAVPVEIRGLIAVGLLGGYTTFSTLSFEAVRLAERYSGSESPGFVNGVLDALYKRVIG